MYGATASQCEDGGVDFPPQSDVIGPPGATAADGAVVKSGRFGTGLNIFISTVGGGLFVVPVLAHGASLVVTLVAIVVFVVLAVAASRMVALAAGINKSPSYSEVIAIVLVGPDCRTTADDGAVGATVMDASVEDTQMLSPLVPNATFGTAALKIARDQQFRQARRDARARRVFVEYALDAIVYLGNVLTCVLYARLVVDTVSPILRHLELGTIASSPSFLFAIVFVLATTVGMMRSLQDVAAAVMVGCVAIVIPVLSIVYCFYASHGGEGYATRYSREHVEWLKFDMNGIAPMLACALVANCYHNVVPQLTREMKDYTVNSFSLVAAVAALGVLVMLVASTVFGYLTFGSAVTQAKGMLLNVYPEYGYWLAMRLLFAINITCAYPVYLVNTRMGVYRLYFRLRQRFDQHRKLTKSSNHRDDDDLVDIQPGSFMSKSEALRISFALRVQDENKDHPIVAPVEVGRTVGYELTALERFGQSLLLASVAVGIASLVQDTSVLSALGGTASGPLLLLFIPSAIAIRVYSGIWHGTPWVAQTGEATLYEPWPLGWWLGMFGLLLGWTLQLMMICSSFGVFAKYPVLLSMFG